MHDPGGISEEEDMGDWVFLREKRTGRDLQTEQEKSDCGVGEVKRTGEDGRWEEETGGEEKNEYKKEMDKERGCGRRREELRTKADWKVKRKREVGEWKVLETTALTRNKAQLFPTTWRPEKRNLVSEDEIPSYRVEEWFASTALKLGTRLTEEQRSRAKRLLYT